jgi:hypothetical protein
MPETPRQRPLDEELKIRVVRLADGNVYIPTLDVVAMFRAMAAAVPGWAEIEGDAPEAVHEVVGMTLGMCQQAIKEHADRLDCTVMMMLSREPDFVVGDDRSAWRRLSERLAASTTQYVLIQAAGWALAAIVVAIAHAHWSAVLTQAVLWASMAGNVWATFALRRVRRTMDQATAEHERLTKIIEADADGPPPHFT